MFGDSKMYYVFERMFSYAQNLFDKTNRVNPVKLQNDTV